MMTVKQYRFSSVLILMAATVANGGAAAQSSFSDEQVSRAVLMEFAYADIVPTDNIVVAVSDGIVSLDGTVSTLVARQQAEEIAATISGVQSINNRIEVLTQDVPPDVLIAEVSAALAQNAATDSYEIDVAATIAGSVTLTGTVESWAEKSLAETVTATVSGVRAVDNQLTVDTSRFYRGAEEINADIAERFRWDARIDEEQIDILVRDGGRVTLAGSTASLAEKRLAVELAQVQGVMQIDAEHLDVVR
jgi:osmotically-inducible protein OsmY